jgi:hypothetical protein
VGYWRNASHVYSRGVPWFCSQLLTGYDSCQLKITGELPFGSSAEEPGTLAAATRVADDPGTTPRGRYLSKPGHYTQNPVNECYGDFATITTGTACALGSLTSFFECLKTIANSLQRVDTARSCVSSAEVSFVSGDGLLSLSGTFVNPRDAVKAISDERPGSLDTLATLPVGKPVIPPTDEPTEDSQGFLAPLKHIQRSCVTPHGKRTIGLNIQRLHVVV